LACGNPAAQKEIFQMTDTSQGETSKPKKQAIAVRDWIDENGKPLVGGQEAKAVGFRYIHLPTAKRLNPNYNPESDGAPDGSYFDWVCGDAGEPATMLAIFGGLTLAGNVVNTVTNGPKGDPNADVIGAISDRFKELEKGVWAERSDGVGGLRYDKDKLAAAIAQAQAKAGATGAKADPATYLAKMDQKVDPKSGATVAADTKGAISYGAFALRNANVKSEYDTLTGGGVQLESL
jgi:hypothetical protein